jgi:NOL1/NOP2/fmu family ribosome biogenesis protein
MNLQFVFGSEKKRIIQILNEQFGISELPYLLIKSGKEKIRFFSGNISREEIVKLGTIARIETLGLYSCKEEGDFRLTIDAIHLLKDQITKNIIEINEQQFHDWIRGQNIILDKEKQKTEKRTYIIKYKDDFIGCGKSNSEILFNYIPKDRRLRK